LRRGGSLAKAKNGMRLVAVSLDRLPALAAVGGFVAADIEGAPLILIRRAEDQVAAFSPVCTHMQCAVSWAADTEVFRCPCHGSIYDKEGNPTSGPAPLPLERYPTALKGNKLIIQLPEIVRRPVDKPPDKKQTP